MSCAIGLVFWATFMAYTHLVYTYAFAWVVAAYLHMGWMSRSTHREGGVIFYTGGSPLPTSVSGSVGWIPLTLIPTSTVDSHI